MTFTVAANRMLQLDLILILAVNSVNLSSKSGALRSELIVILECDQPQICRSTRKRTTSSGQHGENSG